MSSKKMKLKELLEMTKCDEVFELSHRADLAKKDARLLYKFTSSKN